MKSSESESKPFQSCSKGEIPGRARRKERLSRSKLKQTFLTDSDDETFHELNSMLLLGLASKPGLNVLNKKTNRFRLFQSFRGTVPLRCLTWHIQYIYILWCTHSRIALIKLDFPTPESPVMAMFTSTSCHLSSFVLKYSLIRESPCSSTYPLISSWVKTSQSVSIRSMMTERNFSWVEFKIFDEKVVLIRRKTSREDQQPKNSVFCEDDHLTFNFVWTRTNHVEMGNGDWTAYLG